VDALIVGAVVALVAGVPAAWAAWYGARASVRTNREGRVLTGYDALTARLVAERDRAVAETAAAEAELLAERAEVSRLRAEVLRLGGVP
jgi:phage gp37-like protein